VRSAFRPEFLNRIDEIVLFDRLRREDMGTIVRIQATRLQKLLDERKIALTLEDDAVAWLAERGYDPAYGARPLKRVIQRELQDPLAERLLAGDIADGADVRVTAGSNRLILISGENTVLPHDSGPDMGAPGARLH
jgi:ATP-dependent Clp protease ATP-binding subunit ClpB